MGWVKGGLLRFAGVDVSLPDSWCRQLCGCYRTYLSIMQECTFMDSNHRLFVGFSRIIDDDDTSRRTEIGHT
jgi:hypothetical protein